jgi:hypothetical protein
MAAKRKKTNWQYILIVVILAALAGGIILFLEYFWLQDEPSVLGPSITHRVIAPATAIDPNFLNQVKECFLPTAAAYGYALRITDGFRSLDEQEEVYNQGRTEDGHIVSWAPAGRSLHNYGFAVDVTDRWRGYNINWKRIGKIAAFCGLEQADDPHFEYRNGLVTDQFAAGTRPTPLILPCALMDERAKANQSLTLKDLKNCGAPKF